MHNELHYSRPQATPASLGDMAEDHHRFVDKRVLLSGEPEVLATENGRACLLAGLHLLPRLCRNVELALPQSMPELRAACKQVAGRVAFGMPLVFLDGPPTLPSYDAILNVGTTARPDLNWTVINSEGWLARVSSGHIGLPCQCRNPNPMGALAAACLGTTEVFKRLLRLKAARGAMLEGLIFSLFNYQIGEAADPGPDLPERLIGMPLIVGAGAIGNGIVYLLRELKLNGQVWIVDPQVFGPENLGTCILIGSADIGRPKAEVMADYLKPTSSVEWYQESFEVLRSQLGGEVPYPQVVLNGLDNVEARHAVQGIWPDLIIDGAIGTFGCQVSIHPWGEDIACLRCLFQPPNGEPAEQRASRATGLSPTRIKRGDEPVTELDVRSAPLVQQAWLAARIGRPICAVVQEGIARELSDEHQRVGFGPSVPFVAGLSACMVVSEFVKQLVKWPTPLAPRFQMDVLRGPQYGLEFPEKRHRNCLCVTRQSSIDKARCLRQARRE